MILGSFPQRVTLELTNRCNRNCDACPRHKMTYPQGDMSLELLEKIVKQLPKKTAIVPFFRGESICHPKFIEAMKILEKFDEIQMATNGDGLTKDVQNAIIRTCSFISFSIHDFGYPYQFEEIVKFLVVARDDGIDTQISILDSMIISNIEKEMFISSWSKYVNRVRIYIEHSHEGFGDIINKPNILIQSCNKPINDMVVYWDGKVVLCNHDWDSAEPLGDLNTETIKSVWNGEKYKHIRYLNNNNSIKSFSSCRKCDQWMVEYLPEKMFGEVYDSPAYEKGKLIK